MGQILKMVSMYEDFCKAVCIFNKETVLNGGPSFGSILSKTVCTSLLFLFKLINNPNNNSLIKIK